MNQNELEQFIENKLNKISAELDEALEPEQLYKAELDGEPVALTAEQILSQFEPYEPETEQPEECDPCDVVAAIDGVILNTLHQPGVELSPASTKNLVRLAQVRALYLAE